MSKSKSLKRLIASGLFAVLAAVTVIQLPSASASVDETTPVQSVTPETGVDPGCNTFCCACQCC